MKAKRGMWVGRLVGSAGLCCGLAVVVFAVAGWRIPSGDGRLGTDFFFVSAPTGELEVAPAGPFLRARHMVPGDGVRGSLLLRNQTGKRLAVRLRGLPDRPDLDGLLRVEVRSGSTRLFLGNLGGLTHWTPRALVLASGARARLDFRAWLPAGLENGYQGRIASVPFELRARPLR